MGERLTAEGRLTTENEAGAATARVDALLVDFKDPGHVSAKLQPCCSKCCGKKLIQVIREGGYPEMASCNCVDAAECQSAVI